MFNKLKSEFRKTSYSQSGEDIIVDYIFNAIGINHPSYIDIGAYHPYKYNNTAIFYERGCKGINVEPSPQGIELFRKYRKEDLNLNLGVAKEEGELTYYIMQPQTLNTFSWESVKDFESKGYQKEGEAKVKVTTIQDIISEYWGGLFPDFLSLDVEGLDMEILESIDFGESVPKVICVETVEFSDKGMGEKNTEPIKFLESNGYILYSDTNINSIFVQRKLWERG